MSPEYAYSILEAIAETHGQAGKLKRSAMDETQKQAEEIAQEIDAEHKERHLHATLEQRLTAVHKLRFQHSIKTLCRVLRVNRSTYYKRFHSEPAPRTTENQQIRKRILHIYADYDKRLGAYKTRTILERDYGIRVSVGRVYRLMRDMDLPKMSFL